MDQTDLVYPPSTWLVIPSFSCFRAGGSAVFVVMDYASGGDLFHFLRQQPKGRFGDRHGARYIHQVLSALLYVHGKVGLGAISSPRSCHPQGLGIKHLTDLPPPPHHGDTTPWQGLIHRDIKPENILLNAHGDLLLSDFGSSTHIRANQRAVVAGTPQFLAPEMVRNEPYDQAVDLWSVGVLAYELLVGRPPFTTSQDHDSRHHHEVATPSKPSALFFPSSAAVTPSARDFIRKVGYNGLQNPCLHPLRLLTRPLPSMDPVAHG